MRPSSTTASVLDEVSQIANRASMRTPARFNATTTIQAGRCAAPGCGRSGSRRSKAINAAGDHELATTFTGNQLKRHISKRKDCDR
jgi:hypothetical protein